MFNRYDISSDHGRRETLRLLQRFIATQPLERVMTRLRRPSARTRKKRGQIDQGADRVHGQPPVFPTPRAGLEPATIRLTAERSTD